MSYVCPPPFGRARPLIGMIHLAPLPGSPFASLTVREIEAQAVEEARLLHRAGFDGLIVENMGDRPFLRGHVGPEIVAVMTRIGMRVRDTFEGPVGVQVLAGANVEALAVAVGAGLDFVRVEAFVFGHVADEGWLDGCAGPLLRFRRTIGGDSIKIWVDIKKKHAAHAVTADVALADTAAGAAFFGADALIVTGPATGQPAELDDVHRARAGSSLPVLVGSGVEPSTLRQILAVADGVIVGSALKCGGHWNGPIDPDRLAQFRRERER